MLKMIIGFYPTISRQAKVSKSSLALRLNEMIQLRWLAAMLLFVAAMVASTKMSAQTMYTIFDTSSGTLTFKYDKSKPESTETVKVYDVPIVARDPYWQTNYGSSIKKVVFDASFAEVQPKYCYSWFSDCSALTEIDGLKNLNTSEVRDMRMMFYNCSSLTSLDLSSFNTAKVEHMGYMFGNCSSLKNIYVSEAFTTASVTSSSGMFANCKSLGGAIKYIPGKDDATYANYKTGYFTLVGTIVKPKGAYAIYTETDNTLSFKYGEIPESGEESSVYDIPSSAIVPNWQTNSASIKKVVFDASFAEVQPKYCYSWFSGCSALTEIDGLKNLNTSEVNNMKYMFYNCSSLTSLDLSSFNTAKVEHMGYMFGNCSSLKNIYVSEAFTTASVTSSENMFVGCTSLFGAFSYEAGKVNQDYANCETGYFTMLPKGDGTIASPFLITNAAGLAWFRDHVNKGNKTACARLVADIDMSKVCHAANKSEKVEELSWEPISDYSKVASNYWYGTFDGNSHTISNLYVNTTAKYSGLFGYVKNSTVRCSIKNLILENICVTSKANYSAMLAGYSFNTDINGITVNSGTMKGLDYCGGIVGYSDNTALSNCINRIDIIGSSSKIGGFVGYAENTSITNCANYGNVKGEDFVGGIVGHGQNAKIENVFMSGDATSTTVEKDGLLVGCVDGNLTISGYAVYNIDATLSITPTEQTAKAIGYIGSSATVSGESNAIGLSSDGLKKGEGTWMLNGQQTIGTWGQQLGKDDYPVLKSVYKVIRAAQDGDTDIYWATFSNHTSDAELEGLMVYKAKVNEGMMTLTECADCIVANEEGVLVKGKNEYFNAKLLNTTTETAEEGNDLVATPAETETVTADAGYKLYRLTYNKVATKEGLGFYLSMDKANNCTNGTKLKATPGKAYLQVYEDEAKDPSSAALARSFVFGNDSETTGIDGITIIGTDLQRHNTLDGIFDLQGRKISNPTDGIYIKNNKKVIIK